jgi:hypothetical protein
MVFINRMGQFLTREFHFEESNGLGMGGKLGVVGIREFTNGKTVRVEDRQ